MLSCHAKPSFQGRTACSRKPQPRRSVLTAAGYSTKPGYTGSFGRKSNRRPPFKAQQYQRRTPDQLQEKQSQLLLADIQQKHTVQQLSSLVRDNRQLLQAKHLTACLIQLVSIVEGRVSDGTRKTGHTDDVEQHGSTSQAGNSYRDSAKRLRQGTSTPSTPAQVTATARIPTQGATTTTTTATSEEAALGHELLTLCAALGPDGMDSQGAAMSVWAAAKLHCYDQDPGLLTELLRVAALKAGDMRDKELSAVWHGVASLPSGILQASAPALATLLSVTHPISMATWGAHAICTTLWALGRLEAQPSDAWWAELFEVTKDMLRRMNGQEACTFMWALHRMGVQPDPAWTSAFFTTTSIAMLQPGRGYSGRDVASLAWAVASLGLRPSLKWVTQVCEASTPHMASMDARALCGLAYAVSRLSQSARTTHAQLQTSQPAGQVAGAAASPAATTPAKAPTSSAQPSPLTSPSPTTASTTASQKVKAAAAPVQSSVSSQAATAADESSDTGNDEIRRRLPSLQFPSSSLSVPSLLSSESQASSAAPTSGNKGASWRVPQSWEESFLDAVQGSLPHMQGSQVAEVLVSAWRLGLKPDTGWLADVEARLGTLVPVGPGIVGVSRGGYPVPGSSAAGGRGNKASGDRYVKQATTPGRSSGAAAAAGHQIQGGSNDIASGGASTSGVNVDPSSYGSVVKGLLALQDPQLAAALGTSFRMAGWVRSALRRYYRDYVDKSG